MHGQPSWRRWALTALLAVALVAAAIPALRSSAGRAPRPAPPLPTEVLRGPRVSLASLRGRPVVVNFWASWCGACTREAPALERLSRLAPEHAAVVGVDLNDTHAGAMRFLRRFEQTYPILVANGGLVSSGYGLVGLPTSYVIDGRGRIVATLRGAQTVASLMRALRGVAS